MKTCMHASCVTHSKYFSSTRAVVLVALLLAALAPISARLGAQRPGPQAVSSIVEGSRVRVTPAQGTGGLRGEKRVVATVQRVTTDSLALMSESASMSLALSEIALLEVSVGTRRNILRGMGLGLVAGAITGAVVGYADGGDDWLFSESDMVLIGATGLGLLGTVAGGLLGYAITSDVWQPVSSSPWTDRLGVQPIADPAGSGFGARVSWRW